MSQQKQRVQEFISNPHTSENDKRFAGSLLSSLDRYPQLTARQWAAFQSMEARYTPEAISRRQEWESQYSEAHKKRALIAANYYLEISDPRTQWYRSLAEKIVASDDYVPSERAYNALVNNKYAQKIIVGTETPPRFERGALVQFRSNDSIAKPLRNRYGIVVANDLPITTAARGNKTYSILPFGTTHTIRAEERHLKKPRKAKNESSQ